ncbi:methyltransferase domain-containing protein [Candidatus Uhrbacteria bacterium]|nr:methyltransferase domain-containing protein [Candidatus Uhrbacteria bacterium]
MSNAQRRKRPSWFVPNRNGDPVDRYYAEELRAEGYGPMRQRTHAEAERAWAIYRQEWETEDDLRAINDALAPYWTPYIFWGELHGAVIRELVATVERLAPSRVLDVGCGVGLDVCFLAERYPAMVVWGSDLAPAMIERAQARAQRRQLTNARFIVGAHRDLPSRLPIGDGDPGEGVDFAYSHGSLLYHGYDHLRAHMSGIAGVLRPGGIVLCEMPMEVDPHSFISAIVHEMGLGLSLWTDRGEIQTLSVDGREACWCCAFQLASADDV